MGDFDEVEGHDPAAEDAKESTKPVKKPEPEVKPKT